MKELIKYIIRFLLFIGIQFYVLDSIPALHKYVIPVLYFLYILWLPYAIGRLQLLLVSFFFGLTFDFFVSTPGLHAAACTLIAYIRPFVINILSPKDTTGFSFKEPSPGSMGWTPYLVYALVLTLVHHFYVTLLQWLSFGSFLDFIVKLVATTGISMLLIIITELLIPRKQKFRTNT